MTTPTLATSSNQLPRTKAGTVRRASRAFAPMVNRLGPVADAEAPGTQLNASRLLSPHRGGDEGTTVAALRASVARFVEEREWKQFHAPKNLAMALACEASELLGHYLWVEAADSGKVTEDPKKRGEVAAEMADVAICLLKLCNVLGVDLAGAVEAKLGEAAKKHPVDVVKGKSKKYDEY